MYKQPSQKEIDLIIARARAERAVAFGRMIAGIFRREAKQSLECKKGGAIPAL